MLVSDAMTQINDAVRGIDDDTPVFGTDESNYWLRVMNRKIHELYRDVGKQWRPTYKETPPVETGTVATTATTTLTGTSTKFQDYRVGDQITVSGETVRTIDTIASDTSLTVTVAFANTASAKTFTRTTIIGTGVQAYNLHRNFLAPSAVCYVTDTDDHRHYFTIIQPQERQEGVQAVFISDENPEVLNFTEEIEATDQIVGGTLNLPSYYMPSDMALETDMLPVLDPYWLIVSSAAEIAANDLTYEDKAPDLNAKANALYTAMLANNRRGTHDNPRTSAYKVTRITSP